MNLDEYTDKLAELAAANLTKDDLYFLKDRKRVPVWTNLQA